MSFTGLSVPFRCRTCMIQIREYIDTDGCSRYAEWFHSLDARAAAKAATALVRMEQGNFSNVQLKRRDGIFEYRMDFGPGLSDLFRERRR